MSGIRPVRVSAGPVRDFFDALRRLHREAGEPSMRDLAKALKRAEPKGALSHASIYAALVGPRVPRWINVERLVCLFGGDVGCLRGLWIQAREAEDADREATMMTGSVGDGA